MREGPAFSVSERRSDIMAKARWTKTGETWELEDISTEVRIGYAGDVWIEVNGAIEVPPDFARSLAKKILECADLAEGKES
jgi:hypothetical protein